MKIGLELKQEWDTSRDLMDYLRLLSRTLERIVEMEADSPTNWYFEITEIGEDEYTIELTHL